MDKGNKLFFAIFAFLPGILAGNLFFEQLYLPLITLVCLFLIFFISRMGFGMVVFCLVIFIGGWLRGYFVLAGEHEIISFGEYTLLGYVAEGVDVRVDKVKYVLELESLCVDKICRAFDGRFLVNADRYPVFEFGDRLRVWGELKEPFVQDGFDYGKYLKLHGIDYWLKASEVEKIGEIDVAFWQEMEAGIYNSKLLIEQKIDDFFTAPYNDFLKGLLTGSRKGIDVDITTHFQIVGLSHVVAISGYNITLLIVVVGGCFAFLPKNLRILLSAVFIFLFVILVGASAAVVRAGVMGGIALLALYFGKGYIAFRALFIAATVMCFINPLTLLYDTGFQLSFLATLGVVGFSPFMKRWTEKLEGNFWRLLIFEAISSTIISTVTTFPVLVGSFGGLSVIAPLANLLVLPLVSLVMFLGFAAIISGTIVPIVGQGFAFLAYAIMRYIFFVAEYLAGLSYSFVSLSELNFYFCLFYYFVLLLVILRKNLT